MGRRELSAPCERVKLDFRKKETHTPEYLKLNPNGKAYGNVKAWAERCLSRPAFQNATQA